jgi:hypothetical protein
MVIEIVDLPIKRRWFSIANCKRLPEGNPQKLRNMRWCAKCRGKLESARQKEKRTDDFAEREDVYKPQKKIYNKLPAKTWVNEDSDSKTNAVHLNNSCKIVAWLKRWIVSALGIQLWAKPICQSHHKRIEQCLDIIYMGNIGNIRGYMGISLIMVDDWFGGCSTQYLGKIMIHCGDP